MPSPRFSPGIASHRFPIWFAFVFALLLAPARGFGADLDRGVIEAVSDATFEVVVLKPTKDSLSYERPLPMDLIPYAIRKDPYYSVGTAYAIGPNQWVTAAHVLGLGRASQLKTYRLRDRQGKVYDIDQILKYSLRRDFVVFNLKSAPDVRPLTVSKNAQVNDKVYAVGNALGQGVVFRDGLYTSDTPEEEEGQWKWLRFSAAASPGNSGGPLLDAQGRVIGTVLRKSENENLNFALPIKEILDAPEHVAAVDAHLIYTIDNMANKTTSGWLHKTIALPKTYAALDAELAPALDRFGDQLKDELFTRERDQVFPNGAKSLALLYSSQNAVMPGLVALGDDGYWDVFFPQKTRSADLGNNGSIVYGSLGESLMVYFQKPDGVPLASLFSDSKQLMDLVLRGLSLPRKIGPERIKITSMGKAASEEVYVDHYARKWLVRLWNIEHSDEQLVLFALPVPGGFAGMLRIVNTSRMHGHISDLKVLADFAYLSYYGTLDQWRELLALRDLLPRAFADIRIDFEYGKRFSYASKRVALAYGPDEMHITGQSDLKLRFSYFMENGKAVWDVVQVVAGDSKDNSTFFSVARNERPPRQLDDKYKSRWESIVSRQHPYNKSSYFEDKSTLIGSVYAPDTTPERLSGARLLYTAFYGVDGKVEQKSIEAKLDRFMEKLRIRE